MTRFAFALTLALAAGCAADPTSVPTQHLSPSTTPNLTLYVSNQSFDKDLVDIRVQIDGQLAITGDFDVGSQHTWHRFDFELPEGAHTVEVTSADSTATLDAPFGLTGRKYGVIDFWYDADNVELPEHFGWFMTDTEPMFE